MDISKIHFIEGIPIEVIVHPAISKSLFPKIDKTNEVVRGKETTKVSDQIRENINRRMGVQIPKILFNQNSKLAPGEFILKIQMNTIAKEQIPPDKRVYLGEKSQLAKTATIVGQVPNPIGDKQAFLVKEKDWKTLDEKQFKYWTNSEFLVTKILLKLERKLDQFLSYDLVKEEIRKLIQKFETAGYESRKNVSSEGKNSLSVVPTDNPDDTTKMNTMKAYRKKVYLEKLKLLEQKAQEFSKLMLILKLLLQEGIPIVNLDEIILDFAWAMVFKASVHTALKGIRYNKLVRKNLPGNNLEFTFFEVPDKLERYLNVRLYEQLQTSYSSKDTTKKMKASITKYLIDMISYRTHGIEKPALVVKTDTSRFVLQKLVSFSFPDLPVLTKSELLPHLKEGPMESLDERLESK